MADGNDMPDEVERRLHGEWTLKEAEVLRRRGQHSLLIPMPPAERERLRFEYPGFEPFFHSDHEESRPNREAPGDIRKRPGGGCSE